MGYSPWGHKESGMTKQLNARARACTHTHTHTHTHIHTDVVNNHLWEVVKMPLYFSLPFFP